MSTSPSKSKIEKTAHPANCIVPNKNKLPTRPIFPKLEVPATAGVLDILEFWNERFDIISEYNMKVYYYEKCLDKYNKILNNKKPRTYLSNFLMNNKPEESQMTILRTKFETGRLIMVYVWKLAATIKSNMRSYFDLSSHFGTLGLYISPQDNSINSAKILYGLLLLFVHSIKFYLTAFHYEERSAPYLGMIGNGYRLRFDYVDFDEDSFQIETNLARFNTTELYPMLTITFKQNGEEKKIYFRLPHSVKLNDVNLYPYGDNNERILLVIDIPIPISSEKRALAIPAFLGLNENETPD